MRFYTTLISSGLIYILFCCTSCATKQHQLLFEQPPAISDSTQNKSNNGSGTINYRIHSQDILQIRNLQSTKYIVDDAPSVNSVSSGTSANSSQGQTFQVEDDGTV